MADEQIRGVNDDKTDVHLRPKIHRVRGRRPAACGSIRRGAGACSICTRSFLRLSGGGRDVLPARPDHRGALRSRRRGPAEYVRGTADGRRQTADRRASPRDGGLRSGDERSEVMPVGAVLKPSRRTPPSAVCSRRIHATEHRPRLTHLTCDRTFNLPNVPTRTGDHSIHESRMP